ncbi:hypothetical protein LCGC14_1625180 [marine sediment metagenome]|uniref:NTP pyrophosphohydrolase MazG-like domain-containing protein n=2 Tax=marine sediment metagenome TaxID=412755 RepID=A0A0F9I4A8_9ZZZZ
MKKAKIKKLEFIYEKVRQSGTKNSTEQFIYTVEEIGEIAEVLRCLNKDIRKKNKDKNDLASEIGDTLITLYLITKFEDLDFFDILEKGIDKEYNRWKKKKYEMDKEEDLKPKLFNKRFEEAGKFTAHLEESPDSKSPSIVICDECGCANGVHIACGKHVDENGMFIKDKPSEAKPPSLDDLYYEHHFGQYTKENPSEQDEPSLKKLNAMVPELRKHGYLVEKDLKKPPSVFGFDMETTNYLNPNKFENPSEQEHSTRIFEPSNEVASILKEELYSKKYGDYEEEKEPKPQSICTLQEQKKCYTSKSILCLNDKITTCMYSKTKLEKPSENKELEP